MKKRSLSLLLALLMVLSLVMPGTATFADSDSQWANFRNSDVNMAISSAKTPTDADHATLKWASKLGSDWTMTPGAPIIVGNYLVTMAGATINMLSLDDGSVAKTAKLQASSGYGLTPPTYADGLIIAPLTKGTIEAFDASALESKWVYTDALGGQSLSPALYADGKIYVGFWNNEDEDANFVCLDAKTGECDWSYTVKGGFYYAGAVAVGDYILVGTDDGAKGSAGDSALLAFKKSYVENEEIKPVSSAALTACGDVRSSLAYSDGRVYFTSKGGFLCSAAVDKTNGTISDVKSVSFGAQSTSTPIVYGDYIYFGAGNGFSDPGMFIIADKNTLEVVNTVQLKGYAQCSMLLSTAYVENDGYLYFYSTYNTTPGGVSLIKVKADDVSKTELVELYDAAGYENYCICSVICDEDGNLYYKNDSGNVFCLANEYSENVLVSIADKGTVALSYASVTATDRNNDNVIDIDEVLYAAHEKYYDGGAAKGYASAASEYGAYLTTLWGDSSGNFGYFVDNAMSMGLGDAVTEGQHVYAYITVGAYPNNDAYSYFEKANIETKTYAETTVKLIAQNGYDENWSPIFDGYEEAQLTAYTADMKTEVTGFKSSNLGNGKYCISFANAGEYCIVAKAENNAIVPAVCKITVSETKGFFDVMSTDYYYDAALWGSANDIVLGVSDSIFAPNKECTRAQIVTFLYRLAGCPTVGNECSFTDVSDGYYKNAVIWATENNITNGTSKTTFSPDDKCTRAQAVTFLYRYMGSKTTAVENSFSDVNDTDAYYFNAVAWAAENDIARGYQDGTFRPFRECTRAEIVTFIYRMAAC